MKRLDERGVGLVLSMIVVAVCAIMTLTTAMIVQTLEKDSIYQKGVFQAQAAAETGAQDAMLQISTNTVFSSTGPAFTGWTKGFANKSFNGGKYTVTVSSTARPWIVSKGYAPTVAHIGQPFRSVKFKAGVFPIPYIPYGVIAYQDNFGSNITISGAGGVNSYNSETSTAPASFLSSGSIYSVNGSETLNVAPTSVFGTVYFYGLISALCSYNEPSSCSSRATGGCVCETASPSFNEPWVTAGNFLYDNDDMDGNIPSEDLDSNSPPDFTSGGGQLTLYSGVYVFGNFNNSGTLTLNLSTGPVVIFINGTLNDFGDIVNPSGVPANLIIYAPSNTNNFTVANTFYGVLASPSANNITIASPFYGGLVVGGATISAMVYYDLDLQRPAVNAVVQLPGTRTVSYSAN